MGALVATNVFDARITEFTIIDYVKALITPTRQHSHADEEEFRDDKHGTSWLPARPSPERRSAGAEQFPSFSPPREKELTASAVFRSFLLIYLRYTLLEFLK